jgi:uncharacterized membrane protein
MHTMARLDSHSRTLVAVFAFAAALWCAGVVLAPWLEHHGEGAGSWLRLAYGPTCHQQPERCLDLGAGPLAVCARCAGLYAGGLLGLLAAASSGVRCRPRLATLLAAAAPTVLDFLAGLAGLPNLPSWPRFTIALAPGVLLGLLLADAVADLATHVGRPGPSPRRDPVQ